MIAVMAATTAGRSHVDILASPVGSFSDSVMLALIRAAIIQQKAVDRSIDRLPCCRIVLGTNPAAVVLAQAGTHNHQGFDYCWRCHVALLRRMGPCLRGDNSGES